jgi:hypothetical protein
MSDLSYMGGQGYSRSSKATKEQVNQWSGHLNDGRLVNMGRGPTKGNQDYDARQGTHKEPPYSKRDKVEFPKNVDSINAGPQVRTPGGTRSWEPKSGQNYKGNSDKINVGRGPTKGNE